MDQGFICLVSVDVGGTTYVAECPMKVPVGLFAEIGQMVGVVKRAVMVRKNSQAYYFIGSTVEEILAVSKVYSPCWDAKTHA